MAAAQFGHTEVMKMLLEKNVDVNNANSRGETALLLAASGGHMEAMKLLLEMGADVDKEDNDCCTPLDMALLTFFKMILFQ